MDRKSFATMLLAIACIFGLILPIPQAAQQKPSDSYDVRDYMIPMRDGVRLHTVVVSPKKVTEPLPLLLERTPYGTGDASGSLWRLNFPLLELASEGYIFVFQDIRGRFKSEGSFVMLRPVRDRNDSKAIDESTDTYDTVDWLLKNVPDNNGRVGVLGISYGGWLTVMAMIDPHPAVKAVSEQASPADMYLGDDFHHNGAFRLSYGFEYAAMMETSNVNVSFKFGRYDTYEWYLELGALSNANARYLQGKIPTWNDFVEHPNYDEFWLKQAVVRYLDRVTVPNLNVAGWFDQEDFDGPMKIYEALEKKDSDHLNYLIVGPWDHGGWARKGGRTLGDIDFGSDTADYFREKAQAPWFAYWLKDKGALPFQEALIFQTGSNRWEASEAWPPQKNITTRKLYFQAHRRLSFEPPKELEKKADDEYDSYISDPANPVPYRRRPVEATYSGSGWSKWLTEDQRFVDRRPDVLSWETEPLAEDITVSGNIVAHLFVSTTGTDCDWIVKLIDVYPGSYPPKREMGGYQLMVASEVLRGRFRNRFDRPEPMVPDKIAPVAVDLHTNNHRFIKGHQIMVQVQSTWFPLIDRNPQKFVANIFKAEEGDFQKATHRIYRSPRFASYVELPLVTR
jgi:hypothetical protein